MVRRKQGLDASGRDPALAAIVAGDRPIENGTVSPGDPARFESIGHTLRPVRSLHVLRRFRFLLTKPSAASMARWPVMPAWTRASILNVARMPWFSLRPHYPRICRRHLALCRCAPRPRRKSWALSSGRVEPSLSRHGPGLTRASIKPRKNILPKRMDCGSGPAMTE